MSRKLLKSLRTQKSQTEQVKLTIYGSLGIFLGGQKVIQVPDRQGYVYVRLRDNQNEIIQAFNNKVAASYDLPVIVVREGGRYIVQQYNSQRYQNNAQNSAPFLPGHGTQHSFPRGGGADVTWVYPQQIMPALVFPESTTGTTVRIDRYPLLNPNGQWIYAGGTGTQNILQYLPTTGSSSLMTLVYMDALTGNPGILVGSGSYFPANITGSVYPYIPSPSTTQIPLAGVLLNTGTQRITWENIYDVRQWVHATPSGTSSGGGSVTSVNGYTGVVVLTSADVGAEPTFTIANKSAATLWATGTAYVYGNNVYINSTSVIIYYTCIVPHTSSSSIFLDNTKWLYRAADYLVVSDSAYNSALWDGVTDIAPSKNAVRDKFVSIDTTIAGQLQGIVGQNKGVPLGTGTVLNINGSRLIGSFSGTVLNLSNSPDPYDNIGIYALSSGTPLGSGTSINFQYPLFASITGTIIYAQSYSIPADGWQQDTAVWTRTGNHTFTITGDVTTNYRKGTKIRYKDGGAYEYGVVSTSSYSAPNTTVTLITNSDYAMAATTITDTYISYVENPESFPVWFNWTVAWTGLTTTSATIVARWKADSKQIFYEIDVLFGASTAITGEVSFTTPVTATISGNFPPVGWVVILDSGVGTFIGQAFLLNSTTSIALRVIGSSATYGTQLALSSTVPMTWTTSDRIMVNGFYGY